MDDTGHEIEHRLPLVSNSSGVDLGIVRLTKAANVPRTVTGLCDNSYPRESIFARIQNM
jgi:hypothetical protein